MRPSSPLPLRTRAFTAVMRRAGRFDVATMTGEQMVAARAQQRSAAVARAVLDGRARGVVVRDTCLDVAAGTTDGRVPVRLYRGRSTPAQGAPLVVGFHGGGWALGNLQQGDWVCSELAAQLSAVVVSVDYRLAPEDPAPAGFEDCWAVTRWLLANAATLGADAGRTAVMGDSAGGNLAALVAIAHRDALRAGGEGSPTVPLRHQVLVYPATDLTMSSPSIAARPNAPVLPRRNMDRFLELYLGTSTLGPSDPRVSPLWVDDHTDLAPALVQTADNDPLEDDGERYADALRAAGVPVRYTRYAGVPHGFMSFPGAAPAARQGLAEIVQELSRALAT